MKLKQHLKYQRIKEIDDSIKRKWQNQKEPRRRMSESDLPVGVTQQRALSNVEEKDNGSNLISAIVRLAALKYLQDTTQQLVNRVEAANGDGGD